MCMQLACEPGFYISALVPVHSPRFYPAENNMIIASFLFGPELVCLQRDSPSLFCLISLSIC